MEARLHHGFHLQHLHAHPQRRGADPYGDIYLNGLPGQRRGYHGGRGSRQDHRRADAELRGPEYPNLQQEDNRFLHGQRIRPHRNLGMVPWQRSGGEQGGFRGGLHAGSGGRRQHAHRGIHSKLALHRPAGDVHRGGFPFDADGPLSPDHHAWRQRGRKQGYRCTAQYG